MKINFFKIIIYLTLVLLLFSALYDIYVTAYYRAIIWAVAAILFICFLRIKKIPIIVNFSLALIFILIILGEYWLYWAIPFFDKIVHFINPIIICNLVYHLSKKKIKDKKMLILFCIFFVITLSVMWEFVEYGFDNIADSKMQGVYSIDEKEFFGFYERQYLPVQSRIDDTMTDLIFDFLGACAFGIYFLFKKKKE